MQLRRSKYLQMLRLLLRAIRVTACTCLKAEVSSALRSSLVLQNQKCLKLTCQAKVLANWPCCIIVHVRPQSRLWRRQWFGSWTETPLIILWRTLLKRRENATTISWKQLRFLRLWTLMSDLSSVTPLSRRILSSMITWSVRARAVTNSILFKTVQQLQRRSLLNLSQPKWWTTIRVSTSEKEPC